jgi:stage II sporulation protein D
VKQTNWEEMTTRLKKAGYKIGHVESIEPQNIDDSGRALSFLVKHSGGTIVFNSNDFRLSMGPELIRSTRFDIRHEGNEAIFTGLGWGHGVGLCQWGAKGMAEQGFTYKQILSHYYPGTEIIKI